MSEPEKHKLKELPFPAARQLAELIIIKQDINHCLDALNLLLKKYYRSEAKDDDVVAIALFRDAVVQLAGCFGKGDDKLRAEEATVGLDGGMEFYGWLYDLRTSFAAHQFGALRQCFVGAVIDEGGSVTEVSPTWFVYTYPQDAGLRDVIRFAGHVGKFVDSKILALMDVALKKAKELSPNELMKLPDAAVYGVGPSEVGLSRKEFRASKDAAANPSKRPPDRPPDRGGRR